MTIKIPQTNVTLNILLNQYHKEEFALKRKASEGKMFECEEARRFRILIALSINAFNERSFVLKRTSKRGTRRACLSR